MILSSPELTILHYLQSDRYSYGRYLPISFYNFKEDKDYKNDHP